MGVTSHGAARQDNYDHDTTLTVPRTVQVQVQVAALSELHITHQYNCKATIN
jgi:hypothetical protein